MDNLKTFFGKQKIDQNKKTNLVQDVFSEVSSKYDLMNDLMSFGAHRLWKKRFVEIMNIQNNDKIIDIGSGTGDLIKIIDKLNKNVNLISTDYNFKMLEYNKKKYFSIKDLQWINCNAEELPFKNNYFDKYILAFCLRNITLIEKALEEALRILKPGGYFYCLEFSTPQSSLVNLFYDYYKKNIIPKIGDRVANNKNAYKYLEESIENFPNQELFISALNQIGFKKTKYINLFNGIVSIHMGCKI